MQKCKARICKPSFHNGDYFLSEIKIYADAKVDCWELVDFKTFKQRFDLAGW